jgi:hypothetical protein
MPEPQMLWMIIRSDIASMFTWLCLPQ